MNQVAKRAASSTALAAIQSLKKGLQNVQQTLPTSSIDPYLRLLKSGRWVYGQENIEVEDGSLWAVNPMSLRHGYSCWTRHDPKLKKKDEKLGQVMVGMTQPKPDINSLPEFINEANGQPWDWSDCVSFTLVCMSGEDKDVAVLYNTTAVGGMNAVNELINKIMAQLDADPDHPVPLITLECDSYQHRTYGETFYPIFNVDHFVSLDGEMADIDEAELGDEDAPQDEGGQAGGENVETVDETGDEPVDPPTRAAGRQQARQSRQAPPAEPRAQGRAGRTNAGERGGPSYTAPKASAAQPRTAARGAAAADGGTGSRKTPPAPEPAAQQEQPSRRRRFS